MATVTTNNPPTYGNPVFDHGVRLGISWHQTGDEEYRNPNAELIVSFIKDNMLEWAAEGKLNDERLADQAGFLIGWVIGKYHS